MARAGRKRKIADRHPGGQIRRKGWEGPFRMDDVVVNEKATGKDPKYVNVGVWNLMRLHHKGIFDRSQKDAGETFFNLWERRIRLFLDAPPPNAKVANLQGSHGHDSAEQTEDQLRVAQAIDRHYREAMKALLDAYNGKILAHAVRAVVCWNEEPSTGMLIAAQLGLNVLAKHFGVDK